MSELRTDKAGRTLASDEFEVVVELPDGARESHVVRQGASAKGLCNSIPALSGLRYDIYMHNADAPLVSDREPQLVDPAMTVAMTLAPGDVLRLVYTTEGGAR